jgi:uncharacterized membrane protein
MNNLLKYLFICHRIPSRSFFFKGKPFPICARCTGITIGYIIGIGIAAFYGIVGLLVSALLVIPTTLDGAIPLFGRYESTNLRRFVTGLMAGAGIILFMAQLLWFSWRLGMSVALKLIS